jgi:uncharacterized protein
MKAIAGAAVVPRLLKRAATSGGVANSTGESGGPEDGIPPTVHLEAFEYEGVRLRDCMLKKQVEQTRDFYFSMPNDDILVGFRRRAGLPAPGNEYGGFYGGNREVPDEFKSWDDWGDTFNAFGQWLSGMARLSKATDDTALLNKAKTLLEEWAKTIEPNGYFYYSRHPITKHYIYEKTVQGLVDLYAYGGCKDALPLLDKITDYAFTNLDRARKPCAPTATDWASGGTEWFTLPENLYRAYELTGHTKYRDFADVWRYPTYWNKFNESSNPDIAGLHAYSHCNTLSSAAMAYAVHREPEYLDTIVNAYDYFERTQFYATGGYGPGEKLQAPDGSLGRSLETESDTFETPCGSWAGFKLARYLFRFAGDSKYGDWTEKLVYNGIGAALPMTGRGKTFYSSDYRLGGARKVFVSAEFPCCSGTYIQNIADYHNLIYFKDKSSLYVNLFVPSAVIWNHNGTEVIVEQETAYPEVDTTTLTVRPSRSENFDLKFRVPRWTRGVTVAVNGSPQNVTCLPGTWAAITRMWTAGDRVTIQIPMQLQLAPIDPQHPNRVAVMYGPVVLVRPDPARLVLSAPSLAKSFNSRDREGLEFELVGQPGGMMLPFYKVGHLQPYTMYFDLNT